MSVSIDGVLFVKVIDAYKAAYGVEDPHFAVTQLAQTSMRSEIGKLSLDRMFHERDALNLNIVTAINTAAAPWGIQCLRYEIRDISPPRAIKAAMEMQVSSRTILLYYFTRLPRARPSSSRRFRAICYVGLWLRSRSNL